MKGVLPEPGAARDKPGRAGRFFKPSATVWHGQQIPHRPFERAAGVRHDDQGIRIKVENHLAAGATGRDDLGSIRRLLGLGMAKCDDGFDAAIALQHGTAEGDGLGADRKPADHRAEMDPRPNAPIAPANGRRDGVPVRPIVAQQGRARRRDQGRILFRQLARGEGGKISQADQPPRSRRRPASGHWQRRRIARALSLRWLPRFRDDRGGTAWRSRGPGRCAGCHG